MSSSAEYAKSELARITKDGDGLQDAINKNILDIVELCYTKGVELNEYKKHYKAFKQIVKAKSEENNLYKDFKNITSFDGYLTTKAMKNENKIILIKS